MRSCPAWSSFRPAPWYDPIDWSDPDAMCVHGNPNVLTEDIGTSKLAQGCTGQVTVVEVEKWTERVAAIRRSIFLIWTKSGFRRRERERPERARKSVARRRNIGHS